MQQIRLKRKVFWYTTWWLCEHQYTLNCIYSCFPYGHQTEKPRSLNWLYLSKSDITDAIVRGGRGEEIFVLVSWAVSSFPGEPHSEFCFHLLSMVLLTLEFLPIWEKQWPSVSTWIFLHWSIYWASNFTV